MAPIESDFQGIDQDRLARELEDLSRRLKEMQPSAGKDGQDALLAVFRLFSGLDFEDWEALSRHHDLGQYVALPLRGSQYPTVAALLQRLAQLAHESQHDPLTGLLNRRAFDRHLQVEMERSQRMDTMLSLAIIDIDDFKSVNDRFGHPAGDELLRRLAATLREKTRKINVTARIGGEEFAVLLPGTGPYQTGSMLRRLQRRLRNRIFHWNGEDYTATFSAGVTSYRGETGISARQLVKEADQALYRAKARGKDHIELARRSLDMTQPSGMVQAEERRRLLSQPEEEPDPDSQ